LLKTAALQAWGLLFSVSERIPATTRKGRRFRWKAGLESYAMP
jgi:hypothetical protein